MKTNLNRPIKELTKDMLSGIKVICFDGDGVTKKKGTEFVEESGRVLLESYPPSAEMMGKLIKLSKYFHITFSSGREMDYLKEIYSEELMGKNGSLQAEIGMYLWWKNELHENFQLTEAQKNKIETIRKMIGELNDWRIRGFEPKNYLITLHCKDRFFKVEEIVRKMDPEGELYCWWNEEAYDIGLKGINKATGLRKLLEKLEVKMEEVMTVGNGINDQNMSDVAGIDVSTDPKHLEADFAVWGEERGGEVVVDRVLRLVENG
jgi:peptidyl-prolyl cis-trans isomerase B (cyclophilin B)